MASSSTFVAMVPLVLLALVASGAQAAPYVPLPCPTTCSGNSSFTEISSPAGMKTKAQSISYCGRACGSAGYPYYQFSTDGAKDFECACFSACTATARVKPGGGAVQMGYGPACLDYNCPVSCELTGLGALSSTFISDPPASRKTNRSSARNCATFCNGKGLFFQYSPFDDQSSCSCFTSCKDTTTYPGMTPVAMGYVNSCVGLPIVIPSKCSQLLSGCPKRGCPGVSTCNGKKVGAQTLYQCCCPPPYLATVTKGILTHCRPPPQ